MNLSNGSGSMSTVTSGAALKSTGAISDQFSAGLRVLVVDDDPTSLMILEKMLRICCYEYMDGFKLLEHIGLEMDLPIIIISADDDNNVIMKGVMYGACDYLIKPVRIEVFKNIWQHIVRKRMNEWRDIELPESAEEGDRQQKVSDECNWRSSKERRDEEEEANKRDDTKTLKKPRVVWSVVLHQRFVAVVNQLGIN
ncbi:hypothetical protein PIB30_101509, partial [Stylosanthes scabra]|nr:hypothetical protein [Stylosanthes scabra]